MLRSILPRIITAVILVLSATIGFAAQSPASDAKRRFDVPAGGAAQTLARFAEQADREIVFSPAAVRGVQTNAVVGEYSPREALDLLLARTPLVVTQDVKTGAIAVRKGAPDPNAPRAAPVAKSDRPTNPSHDDTIVMTPFEVRTDSGDAYGVTQSNRATMFNADTTKLPINSETFTSQFLQDIDMQDMDILVSGLATGGGWGSMQNDSSAFPKQPGDRVANTEFKLRAL